LKVVNRVRTDAKPQHVQKVLRPLLGSKVKKVKPGDMIEYPRERPRQLSAADRNAAFEVLDRVRMHC
jgi:hypothetical protein